MWKCEKCGHIINDSEVICPNCGTVKNGTSDSGLAAHAAKIAQKEPEKPMAWFKFLITFWIFAGIIGDLLVGFQYGSGAKWMDSTAGNISYAKQVYEAFPLQQSIDYMASLVLSAAAILRLFARGELARYNKKGPLLFYICLILEASTEIVWSLMTDTIVGGVLADETYVTGLFARMIFNIVFLWLNVVYFNKRRELFGNTGTKMFPGNKGNNVNKGTTIDNNAGAAPAVQKVQTERALNNVPEIQVNAVINQSLSNEKTPLANYCSNCGTRLRPGDKFCKNCGKKIE